MLGSDTPLTLAEQVVLLCAGGSHRRVGRALKLAELPERRETVRALQNRGLLTHVGRSRRLQATSGPVATFMQRRLLGIVRGVQAPEGEDAELLLLVAYADGLNELSAADHLGARHRIADLGGRHGNPPPLLALMIEDVGVSSATELADVLLPGRVRLRPGDLDPGVTPAVWGGGHGGGTLG